MPSNCRSSPSRPGLEPRTGRRARSSIKGHAHAKEKPLSTKLPQRNNVVPAHTVNVVFPETSHATHLAPLEKSEQALSLDRSQNRSSTKKNDTHPNAEFSAVPDPVPNPLFQTASSATAVAHTSPLFGSSQAAADSPSPSAILYPSSVTVSNPLLSLPYTASPLSSALLSPAEPTSVSSGVLPTFIKAPSRQTTSHQIPAAAITLLTIGGVFFVIVILIGTKLCIQPRRRSHPTPSLPILQDASPPRKTGDESPLFGGKERLSSQTGMSTVPWTWTQYHVGIPKPLPAASVSQPSATSQPMMRYSRLVDETPSAAQEVMGKPGATSQASDGHSNKGLSRLSSLSGLVHPPSMYESSGQENIGIAVSSGQGEQDYGVSSTREPGKRASARQSLRNFDKRRSTLYGSPEGLAYTMSPSTTSSGDSSGSRQGRARVKAPYGAGSFLRGTGSTRTDRAEDRFGDVSVRSIPGLSSGRAPAPVANVTITPVQSPGLSLYPDSTSADEQYWVVPPKTSR
ncbi:hypothetical protein BGW80DRAFT_318605 [Lactifluus volemus]|nr:hypothetical protein BGW80DRAFT_318605 [Lactifluus volemus]